MQVFSLEDSCTKGLLTLPPAYMPGAVRASLSVPTVGGQLGEIAGVVLQVLHRALIESRNRDLTEP